MTTAPADLSHLSPAGRAPEHLPAVPAEQVEALAAELRTLLGDTGVSDEAAALDRASVDGAEMSPVVKDLLPLGRAQLVAYPKDAEQIAAVVGAAVRHGVPVTVRGKGTGNYGQAIPMAGGLVLDTTRARSVVEVGEGYLVADAGAPIVQLEQAAMRSGQQLLMYPSTVQSTLGGFVSGGSGGTGSIKHGMLHNDFVTSLDVVHAVPDAELIHLEGKETEAYLHNYGTAGVIARIGVALEPAQDWRAFYASFEDVHDAFGLIRQISALEPTPRLVSADGPRITAALPADEALPADRSSLRAILDAATVEAATALVEAAGGTVEAVREGLQQTMKLSTISYNHPIEWLMKSSPDERWFHVEVSGDSLVDRLDEVQEVYPGALLHIEGQAGRPIGMLAAPYTSSADVWPGFERLVALEVGFHNPHQWYVDYQPDAVRAMAPVNDPHGLLNPGKLAEPTVWTGAGSKMVVPMPDLDAE
ncbi:FAD-binding oxidoreductase [Nocardioides sp. GY 10127]|uniref:FAD-binding oxidoreductase n=1 Tax=Nocardioides sp. GY 10127 TaxID=2569762 RepID=UPI0010A7B46F|nr:FAD-binding oxidoreductase [Nocardioides sp. GY 10127]TIC81931.1 FAD-binding oxidoreductase [Nocardioides sp. GY 10127]